MSRYRTEALGGRSAATTSPNDAPVQVLPRAAAEVRYVDPGAHLHDHDILTTAGGSKRLTVFVDFIRAAGLSGLLEGRGRFTVFAPTDRAFSNISLRDRDALLANRDRLTRVMRGHIVSGDVSAPQPGAPTVATTIDDETLTLTSTDGTYRVGDARLVQTSIRASNGVIHAIDLVLL